MNRSLAVKHFPGTSHIVHGSWVRRMKLDPLLEHSRQHQAALSEHYRREHEKLQQLKLADNIALVQYLDFFAAVSRALGDPCLGMRIGLSHRSHALSPVQNLFFNGAPSLYDALLELNHSAIALQNNLRTGIRIEHGQAYVSYQLSASPEGIRHDIEYSLGLLTHALRTRLGAEWSPQEIHLCHPLHACERTLLTRLLGGARIVDSAGNNCIVFPAHLLNQTCSGASADENVLIFFRQYLNDLCIEHSGQSIREKLRVFLHHCLRDEHMGAQAAPTLEWAASHLHLSARSLQRKLALEQTTFSSVLEQVRHTLALEWMRRPDIQIGAMAEKLGYADHATFCNAFKRWAGVAPSRYRMSSAAH